MDQEDLRQFVSEDLLRRFLRMFESRLDLIEIRLLHALRSGGIAGSQKSRVHAGKAVVLVIDRHVGDAVMMLLQKIHDLLVNLGGRAGVEERVAEPAEFTAALFD